MLKDLFDGKRSKILKRQNLSRISVNKLNHFYKLYSSWTRENRFSSFFSLYGLRFIGLKNPDYTLHW